MSKISVGTFSQSPGIVFSQDDDTKDDKIADYFDS